jgi:hypothetical protein
MYIISGKEEARSLFKGSVAMRNRMLERGSP